MPAVHSKHGNYLFSSEIIFFPRLCLGVPLYKYISLVLFAFHVVLGKNEVIHCESAAYFVDFLSPWLLFESDFFFFFSFSSLNYTFTQNLINCVS